LKLVAAASLQSVDMPFASDQTINVAGQLSPVATQQQWRTMWSQRSNLLCWARYRADDDRHGRSTHAIRHCSALQLQPRIVAASASPASAAADLAIACAEACRRPVLLHALAQLRRQSIFPLHHAGVVAVRTSRRRPALCTLGCGLSGKMTVVPLLAGST
jgi:hypothetical protein